MIKISKGLDIHLQGRSDETLREVKVSGEYALCPDDFPGVTPKLTVKEGDRVLIGEALFVNKQCPQVKFASPVSGIVTAVQRGERRKVLAVRVKADDKQVYAEERGWKAPDGVIPDGDEVIRILLDAGLFGYINQLPYAVSATPLSKPKGIFVSALRDMPLAASFEFELRGNEEAWQAGLTALSHIQTTYLGIGFKQTAKALREAKDVEINIFKGPCPAGNVDVQINHISPVNKGEVVWTVDPTAVIFFGRLLLTGRVDLRRTVALCGSEVIHPQYVSALVGTSIDSIINENMHLGLTRRIINGNVLTGRVTTVDGFLGAHSSEVTIIPEGDEADEMLGWALPRLKEYSASRTYFSWLRRSRPYRIDARIKGGERHMIMSGEYDSVLPMNIYGEYLIKAILAGDIDRQEQLGIYEVAPEDFALAEFIDSSKLPLQKIVRDGLDILRKENS